MIYPLIFFSMKRSLIVLFAFLLIMSGCTKKVSSIDVNAISDLAMLQTAITQVSEDAAQGLITIEQAQELTNQLQQRYIELTDITQQNIEIQFEAMEKIFSQQSVSSYSLPLRAKKL